MPRPLKPNEHAQRLFDSLVQRHGTSEITVAVCRSMAVLLANEVIDPRAAQSAAALASLLPPIEAAAGDPWDLQLLTGSQLRVLERLSAIAHGKAPAKPVHRRKSARYWLALQLAAKLDAAVDAAGGASETAMVEVRSLVMSLLSPLLVQDLFRTTLESAFAPQVPQPSPPPVEVQPAPTPQPPPAQRNNNVVFFDPNASGGSHPCLFDAADPSGRGRGMP